MQFPDQFFRLLFFTPMLTWSIYLWIKVIKLNFATRMFAPRSDSLPKESAVLLATGLFMVVLNALLPSFFFQLYPIAQDTSDYARELHKIRINVTVDFAILFISLLAIWPLLRDERQLIGLHLKNPMEQCRSGVTGLILSIFPVAALLIALFPFRKPEHLHGMLKAIHAPPSFEIVIWVIISAVIAAPLAEEMLYRVLFQEGLIVAGHPPRLVIPAVAIFFCLNHGNPNDPSSYLQTLPLLPLALLFGLVYHLRNSFLASVLMHMLFNAANILLALSYSI